MTICEGCGQDFKNLPSHKRWCKGKHLLSTESIADLTREVPDLTMAVKKPAWYRRLFSHKQKAEPKKVTVEEMLTKLPKWSIKEGKPWFVGENKKRKLIQFVGVSRLKPPVMAWVFWDGIFISVEDRLYQPPHDIRGSVFFYDLDNSRPLLDNVQEDDETHESLRMSQVKNIAYAMGRIAGAQDLLKNLGLILLGIGFIVLLEIGNLYLSYQTSQGFAAANVQIGNITSAVQDYISTHP